MARAKRPDRIPFEAMSEGVFAALLAVPEAGYRWDAEAKLDAALAKNNANAEGLNSTGPYLVLPDAPDTDAPRDVRSRAYSPFAVPGLHRRFARLAPTETAILDFANEHGWLGLDEWLEVPNGSPIRTGESLWLWRHHIAKMARLLEVWDQVRREDAGGLAKHVVWHDSPRSVMWREAPGLSYHFLAVEPTATRPGLYSGLLEQWRPGEILGPARYYVHDRVNLQMSGNVSPAVLPFRQGDIYLYPRNLLAALYVLFALELSGRTIAARQCKGCGRYFTPTRSNQLYCDADDGGTCRKRAWYHRSPNSPHNRKEKADGTR